MSYTIVVTATAVAAGLDSACSQIWQVSTVRSCMRPDTLLTLLCTVLYCVFPAVAVCAGPVWLEHKPTGFGVKLLVDFLLNLQQQQKK